MLYWILLIQIYEGIFEWKQIIYTWNFFDFFVCGFSLNRKKSSVCGLCSIDRESSGHFRFISINGSTIATLYGCKPPKI